MHNNMWWQTNIIRLNSGSLVKDLFFKRGGERLKSSHLNGQGV
jgi:hypothetical protein